MFANFTAKPFVFHHFNRENPRAGGATVVAFPCTSKDIKDEKKCCSFYVGFAQCKAGDSFNKKRGIFQAGQKAEDGQGFFVTFSPDSRKDFKNYMQNMADNFGFMAME